jgi:hypothetical protein
MRQVVKKLVLLLVLAWCGVAAADEPPRQQRQREILRERPSGFWTSNRPAEHGAYRWRLLGLGVVIAGGMGFMIVRTLRRARPPSSPRPR